MARRRFNLIHSIASVALLCALEGTSIIVLDAAFRASTASTSIALLAAGAIGLFIILIAAEVIREVKESLHMLALLSAVVLQFIIFFAFQYWFLSLVAPGSYQGLPLDPIGLMLHSTMAFALNPLYLPTTTAAQALLLIQTLEALVLALFVLQNIWQFRARDGGAEA